MIKVYSTITCPWCVKTKKYLTSKKIAFEEIDVSEDMSAKEEMVLKSKQMGVPVLDINGTIIIGFDKPAIDLALTK